MTKVDSVFAQFRLDNKIAFITGAGDGLGRIAALALGEAGAHVCVSDINLEWAEKVAEEIMEAGGAADARKMDVANNPEIESGIAGIIGQHGRIDILVNNVGLAKPPGVAHSGPKVVPVASDSSAGFLISQSW